MERFYSIKHLSTEQLRELYTTYRSHGWVDACYYRLTPVGVYPPKPPEAEILLSIDTDNKNYFVFMLGHEDEEDGVMIGFGLSYYPDFGVYLHLSPGLLNELVEKYSLHDFKEAKDYSSWTEYLAEQGLKNSLN
jgi:hypothetical protein